MFQLTAFGVVIKRRARRRALEFKAKVRTATKMNRWYISRYTTRNISSPREIGRESSVHCRRCSCFGCIQHKEVPPRRERPFLKPTHANVAEAVDEILLDRQLMYDD